MSLQQLRFRRSIAAVGGVIALVSGVACSSGSDDAGGADDAATTADASTTTEPSDAALAVEWMDGFESPGTPEEYNKVGVLAVGDRDAPNVLVLEPGTSAGSAYFVPLAQDIVDAEADWQVWAVERRQNLLEDQSELTSFKEGDSTNQELFDYYLGYLNDEAITDRTDNVDDADVEFAKQWGLRVAVEDLRVVIDDAVDRGGKVVLGGHSLGGSVTTAFATWDFDGSPGAEQLDGLVYIDGGSRTEPIPEAEAQEALDALNDPDASPWLSFGGIPAPFAGIFNTTGAAGTLFSPDEPSRGAASGLLPEDIVPPVEPTNAGQYGYALDVGTSPESLAAAQAHLGAGLDDDGMWDSTGALTPIERYATMFSGGEIADVDGNEWYFPQRLTNDTRVIGNGNANPAQELLGVEATLGDQLPEDLFIYAFGARLGGEGVPAAAEMLAEQSGIPEDNLTLLARPDTYAHNDPLGASPDNEFLDALLPFLEQVADA